MVRRRTTAPTPQQVYAEATRYRHEADQRQADQPRQQAVVQFLSQYWLMSTQAETEALAQEVASYIRRYRRFMACAIRTEARLIRRDIKRLGDIIETQRSYIKNVRIRGLAIIAKARTSYPETGADLKMQQLKDKTEEEWDAEDERLKAEIQDIGDRTNKVEGWTTEMEQTLRNWGYGIMSP